MSNHVILWGMVIIPWLSLFLMPGKDVKRFLPAGLFTTFLGIIASEVGVANGWWYFRETIYPLAIFSSFTYGLYPIIPLWVLKYTYGRFWRYLLVETTGNAIFIFIFLPWLASRGILDFPAQLIAFTFTMIIAFLLYSFQMWQEGVFERSAKTKATIVLQPAVSKLLDQDEPDRN
jgi:uncharacterized membrane protein